MSEEKLEFASDEFLNEMYEASKMFGDGIYVRYSDYDTHPCGWEFISFENIDNDEPGYDIFEYEFKSIDISNGIYSNHEFIGMTLKDILKIVGRYNWGFEGV